MSEKVEIQNLKDDIKVFYIQAESFPWGVKAAHEKLHSLLHPDDKRRFFGISFQNQNGDIVYRAASEETFPGETEKYGLDTFTIRKGDYICETLIDWCSEERLVEKTFRKLLSHPRLDRNGYCLEEYLNDKDMLCMVKLI